MSKINVVSASLLFLTLLVISCTKNNQETIVDQNKAIRATFRTNINPALLENYANQVIPSYILKDNTGTNSISDKKATLGRVLFYDKQLSFNNTISCGSCHKQSLAFGDSSIASSGVAGGLTGRHSMRLVNVRFSDEFKCFWDERAATLEIQTTKPIQDHAEMGFSGLSGRPTFNTLLQKLSTVDYYNELFKFAYGDVLITENRIQECLAQFVRSIQSFDSKFDAGRFLVNNDRVAFSNFSTRENTGKDLYMTNPIFDASANRIGGGLGCNQCHKAPEFDIDPNSKNNGIIGTIAGGAGLDITVTKSPSLRNLLNTGGIENGPFMHTGNLSSLQTVIGHYGNINIAPGNNNLDRKLTSNGIGQHLNLTAQEVNDLISFLKTLSGNAIYVDKKWSNPFISL